MAYPKTWTAGQQIPAADMQDLQTAVQTAQARADYAASLIPGGATPGQPGKVLLDSFSGASDDAKLTNALSYAAAQTYRPVIMLGARYHTFSQARTVYSGLRICGPAENVGMQNIEVNNQLAPGRVHLTTGTGSSAWLVGTSQTYSVAVQDIAFSGNGSCQFYDHPISAGTAYAAMFRNLQFSGVKHVFGRPAEAMSCTLVAWEGAWNFTGVTDEQISLRGSDNWFVPSIFNIGWNNAPANKYVMRMSNVSKSWMSNIYVTCRNTSFSTAGCRGFLIEGPGSQQGGLFISNCVIEGQNLNEYCTGALINIQGGGVSFDNISMNFGMGQPALSGDTADIMVSGGNARLRGFDMNKATPRSDNSPVIRHTGGKVSAKDFYAQGQSPVWGTLPLATSSVGGSAFKVDDTLRTA